MKTVAGRSAGSIFPTLVSLFELSAKEPLSQMESTPSGNKYRLDAKDSKYFSVRTFEYWNWCDGKHYPGCIAVVDLYFNTDNICISNLEVRRLYGEPKSIAVPSHGEVPKEIRDNPVGFGYTEIRETPLGEGQTFTTMFSFAGSGCTRMIQLMYPLDVNQSR